MYNTRASDFHIICDDNAERLLRSRLDLVQNPFHHVRVWFYKPTWQSMLDRIEREGSITTEHESGIRESLGFPPVEKPPRPFYFSWTYEALHPGNFAINGQKVYLYRH